MKAAVFREYNKDPTKIVKIEDIDVPKIKSYEVLIKVESASYNYNDLWAMWGEPVKTPLPHISGSDIGGTVVEVGPDVRKIKVGDRVVSHSNMSDRVCYECTSGREYDCNERTIWGFQTGPLWGGFAQYTHLPEVNVVKIADNVSFNDAAAVSMVGMTSWHMLVGRAKIKPGQLVLIMGGGSGVGMVGIQIAKLYNCTVIATAGNKDKMDKCMELGADYTVNHREADWYKKVREITKKLGQQGQDQASNRYRLTIQQHDGRPCNDGKRPAVRQDPDDATETINISFLFLFHVPQPDFRSRQQHAIYRESQVAGSRYNLL